MPDIMFPPHARVSAARMDLVSNTAVSRSIFTGSARRVQRGGDRFRAGLMVANSHSSINSYREAPALKSLLSAARGQANVIYYTPRGYTQGGSFPATELITNTTFDATTGWTPSAQHALTVSDRVLRITRAASSGTGEITAGTATVTQYAPYHVRMMAVPGRGSFGSLRAIQSGVSGGTTVTAGGGMITFTTVPIVTSFIPGLEDSSGGVMAGDYLSIPFASLARCALVDIGTNLLLQSDELDTSWNATRSSVDDQTAGTVAPDGTSTADSIIEDSTAASTHLISQSVTVSSAVAEYSFCVALKAGARTWARITIVEATGGSAVSTYVNLSTGALGTLGAGVNWSNARAFARDMGNGWHYVCIVGRKTNSATTLTPQIYIAEADNDVTFNGDGASNIYAWRATLAQSSVPTRLVSTTTAASTGTTPSGSFLHLKGLPASTAGLLLRGDFVEVLGSGLHRVTAALNSDAAGLGYLQFEPALHSASIADNTAVIVHKPMGRFILSSNENGWDERPGGFSDFEIVMEECLTT